MNFAILAVLAATALACEHAGKKYSDGEEWVERNSFKMKCKIEANGSWRVQVSGCITPDGLIVPINSSKPVGQYEWECMVTPGGQISLKQIVGKTADCTGGHAHGTQWTEKSFRFRCDEGGTTTFVGCLANDGTLIPDGETKEIGGFDVQCKKHSNGTVSMGAIIKADGSCRDSNGVTRKAGENWVESEHFVKECKNGIPFVTGCKIPELENPVPLNGKSSKGKMDYFCEGTNGTYRVYSKVQQ